MARVVGRRPKQFVDRGLPVPYVALWDTEHQGIGKAVQNYWDERRGAENGRVSVDTTPIKGRYFMVLPDPYPFTTWADGVRWLQPKDLRGRGRADFGEVHATRQRACMTKRLCQVCGGRMGEGAITWVTSHPVVEGKYELTSDAPVCDECYEVAITLCPHLRKKWRYVYRVRRFEQWGARFKLKELSGGAAMDHEVQLAYEEVRNDEPLRATTMAGQAIVRFDDFELIEQWHAE